MLKVAINGFGRIGRAAAKIILERDDLELVAINDLGEVEALAHLLKYDSSYGIYPIEVGYDEGDLLVGSRRIHVFSEKEPEKLPWRDLGIDVVIESTGVFTTSAGASAHLVAGAKKVIISAPAKDKETKTFVMGVNEDKYRDEKIISCASCTTNCVAPIMKALEEEYGIEKSLMTTIHSYTADQNLVDGPHKDLRRGRAAALNIVPTSTGAAKTTGLVIPELKDNFDGLAIRVPTPVASLSDITVLLMKETTVEKLNELFEKVSAGKLKGIVTTTDEPLVSSDIVGNKFSSIVDLSLTQVVDGNLIKIIAWYDNEWGYSERLVDLASFIGSQN